MKALSAVLGAAALALSFGCEDDNASPVPPPSSGENRPVASRLDLQDDLRRLGAERVFWTRVFLIDSLHQLPDKDVTLERLMKNQLDLGNALAPYYGAAMGAELSALLVENVRQMAGVIATMQAGTAAQAGALVDQWRAQTNLVADLLAKSNPSIDGGQLRAALQLQLDATLAEATARLAGDWTGDVLAYDTAQDRAALIADSITTGTATQYPDKVLDAVESQRKQQLHLTQRELWLEHVMWERLLLISSSSGGSDLAATTARLMRNQRELGDSFKPLYGEAVGNELTRLLEEHVTGAVSTLSAARSGNPVATNAASALWTANASELAAFFARTIPSLNAEQLEAELRLHLEHTVMQAAHRAAGRYQAEIEAYDEGQAHSLGFADQLTSGIATQAGAESFPD